MPDWMMAMCDLIIAVLLFGFCVFAIGMLLMITIVCIRYWIEKRHQS